MDEADREYAKGLARALAGAVIFAVPLMMTMEMWWLGFYMDRERLLLFIVLNLVVLAGISHFAGFEPSQGWGDDVMDGFAAFGVGLIASVVMLALLGILTPDMPLEEIVGKSALQAVPASIGAVLARKQLGARERDKASERKQAGYPGQLFLMGVGALFLAFNVAPTEEMPLIAQKMTAWHALALVGLSVVLLHAFVYAIGFAGQEQPAEGNTFATTLLHYSIAGYGIALIISLYVLWTFGRTDETSPATVAQMVAVMGFPASLGAALARLIV